MRPFRIATVVFAALTIAFQSGCGGQRTEQKEAVKSDSNVKETRTVDACSLLSEKEIGDIVGNAVDKGHPFAGPEVCKWETGDDPAKVDVLLTVRAKGSVHEKTLCTDLRNASDSNRRIEGLGDIATWKFSRNGTMFNSGDLEICGPKGYANLLLQGKKDEPTLKTATTALARKVLERL